VDGAYRRTFGGGHSAQYSFLVDDEGVKYSRTQILNLQI
jgi:hypothetical protein